MEIQVRSLKSELWKDLEALFTVKGACGGCWCMWWRQEKREAWSDCKGAKNKSRFRKLVQNNRAKGFLAYVDGEPVGWLSYGPRVEFLKLDRAPSLACDDAEKVISLPCFYIKTGFRRKGVAKALLAKAVAVLGKKDVVLEAYPTIAPAGSGLPDAFAFTGVPALFEEMGFKRVSKKNKGRIVMRWTK